MARVLRIINRFNLGGPTYNAAYLTRYLPAPYETLLIGGVPQQSEESSMHILDSIGVKARVIPEMQRAINPGGDYAAYKKIRSIIREYKPDIVHTHASKAGFLGRMAAKREKVPHVVHTFHGHVFHSYFSPWKTAVYKNLERYLARNTDAIIAISPLQKQELNEKHNICPPGKVHVVPLGFDLERFRTNLDSRRETFRSTYGVKHSDILVGIIGRLVPVKDHAMFLRAFAEARKKTGNALRAFIAGDGESRDEIFNLSAELGLEIRTGPGIGNEPIIFASWVKEVESVLPGLEMVALSSLNEGTPVSLIEAQAAGIPVISTRAGGVADVVNEGVTGLLSPVSNVNAFAENMIQLAESPGLRKEMGENGWEHVRNKFSVQRLVSDISSLYDGLLRI